MDITFYEKESPGTVRAELFHVEAKACAERFAKEESVSRKDEKFKKKKMSYTQIRKFYNQLLAHRDKVDGGGEDGFKRELPFIRMLAAKASYSKAREHVNQAFCDFIEKGVSQVATKEDLQVFCSLFEAVLAFGKEKLGK